MTVVTLILIHVAVNGLMILYGVATILTGRAILNAMGMNRSLDDSAVVALAAALTIGQGVLGTVWQGLAMLSIFYWWLVLPVLMAGTILGFPNAAERAAFAGRYSLRKNRSFTFGRPDRPETWFAVAACIVMLLFFPLSVLPPGTDAMAFYLAEPKLIAAAHYFLPLPGYETFSQIGLASELHYSAFFSLGGDRIGGFAGRLFIWVLAVANLILAWGIGERLNFPAIGRWFIVILVLTSTAFTLLVWDGKTDLVPTALAVLAMYLLLAPMISKGNVAIAGLATGLACVGKLSFILSFGVTIGFLLCFRIVATSEEHRPRQLIVSALRFGAWAAVPFVALAFKNAIVFGEPFAPFVLLKAGKAVLLDQVWFNPENTAWIVKTYPVALIFGQYPMQHGNISALLLVAIPLLFWVSRTKITTLPFQLAAAGLAGILVWVILRPSVLAPRYIFPSLLALLPAAALLMSSYWKSSGIVGRRILTAAIAASLLVTAWDAVAHLRGNLLYITRLSATVDENPIWRVADMANNSGRPNVRVLNMMYYSSMYRSDLLACMLAYHEDILKEAPTISEYWEWAYKHGITVVSFDRLTHERRLPWPLDPAKVPSWLEVKETKIDERFSSYELFPRNGAPEVSSPCTLTISAMK